MPTSERNATPGKTHCVLRENSVERASGQVARRQNQNPRVSGNSYVLLYTTGSSKRMSLKPQSKLCDRTPAQHVLLSSAHAHLRERRRLRSSSRFDSAQESKKPTRAHRATLIQEQPRTSRREAYITNSSERDGGRGGRRGTTSRWRRGRPRARIARGRPKSRRGAREVYDPS
jgi:septum formation inhibitor MinC